MKKCGEEYRVCSITGKRCHYTEFTKAGFGWLASDGSLRHPQSKEGKRFNMALSNGLRLIVDRKLVGIAKECHPNNQAYKRILEQVRDESGYKGAWLRSDLSKEAYLRTYKELGISAPNFARVKGKKFGRASKEEVKCLEHLGVPDNDKHRQVWIGKYCVDGVIGSVVYEFMGDYYHANPRLYEGHERIKGYTAAEKWEKDRQRAEIIKAAGYELIVIWESDWNEFKQGITSELKTEKW